MSILFFEKIILLGKILPCKVDKKRERGKKMILKNLVKYFYTNVFKFVIIINIYWPVF